MVLPRQDLGRRHERALPPGPHGRRERDRRNCGLPAADVSLQQPAHRPLAGDIVADLAGHGSLVLGQLERQRGDDRGERLITDRDLRRAQVLAGDTGLRERQLEREELIEREAVERFGHVRRLLGEVRGAERVREARQAGTLVAGEWVVDRRQPSLQDPREELTQPLLRHPGGEVVDGHDAGRVDRLASDGAELGRGELRTPAALRDAAGDDDLVTLVETPLDEPAAEPDASAVPVSSLSCAITRCGRRPNPGSMRTASTVTRADCFSSGTSSPSGRSSLKSS